MRVCLLFLFGFVPLAHSESRTWTSLDGRTVTAELVASDDNVVTIRNADGRVFAIPRSALSEKDQTFLKSYTTAPVREGKISFDEGGKTLSQVTGSSVILSGACDLEGAVVTLSGAVRGTSKVAQGRWEIHAPALETWAKGAASLTVTALAPGSKAGTTMTLNFFNLLEEGAKGDGITDDTNAINAAAKRAAAVENGILLVPEGRTFAHASLVILEGVEMLGCGQTSVLLATNPLRSAVTLRGVGPRLRNLVMETRLGEIKRQTTPDTTMVWVDGASLFWVDAVHVKNGASGGIFNFGGSGSPEHYSRISRCVVEGTLADAFHNTRSAHHVMIESNIARNNGDDCFAVVSYKSQLCHDIVIKCNKGTGGKARGISVVGGKNILIEDNELADKEAAGILVASEEPWETNLVERVTVRNNLITGCPTVIKAHGGIFVNGRKEFPVTEVLIEGNQVKDSPAPGIHLGSYASQITLRANQIIGSKGDGILARAVRDLVIQDNGIESSANSGIFVTSDAAGECRIQENKITEANLDEEPENAMIRIANNTTLKKVEITGNRFKAGRTKVREEIVCRVEKAVIKGNR